MLIDTGPTKASPALPTPQPEYSPSARALGTRLIESLSTLRDFRNGAEPMVQVPLGAYLSVVDSRETLSPRAFQDALWKAAGAVSDSMAAGSDLAAVFDAAHNLLVRNSASGHAMGGLPWIAGTVEDLAKVYFVGGLRRASIGLTREPFLWQAPSILLALSAGREADPHLHERTVETGLSFSQGTKVHRHLGTPNERIDTQDFGSWLVVPPGEMHRVDSSDARVYRTCVGYSVAFPGAGLDRFVAHEGTVAGQIEFSSLSYSYNRSGAKINLNLLAQRNEGVYLQPHMALEPGTVLRIGEFAGRAKNTIVAVILVGGDFIVTDGSRETRIGGEGMVLTDGVPFTCHCISRGSRAIPMQLGLTVALPHHTEISRINPDDLISQFSLSGN